MNKFEIIPSAEKEGNYYQINISIEAADAWLKYFRLLRHVDAGNEQARKEYERMDTAQLVREVEEDEEKS